MTDFLFWGFIGACLALMLYGLPVVLSGLIFGMDAADPRRIPPIPPTRAELLRRARYFEDTQ